MPLDEQQLAHINSQLAAHQHDRYETDLELGTNEYLHNFVVYPHVLRPEAMAALFLARWLYKNQGVYRDKISLDMGSGSGLQGVVLARYGARVVIMSDIYEPAVVNSRVNVKRFGLEDTARVLQGDLFANVDGHYDVIVFNHPFFADKPRPEQPVSSAFLDEGELRERFFEKAPKYLREDGIIIMPYLHFAGEKNDPGVQARLHGLKIIGQDIFDLDTELQRGRLSIYKIAP